MNENAFKFLSGVAPFSFLPEEELKKIASEVSTVHYPKDTILFVQERSRIECLYIIQKGAAERYYEQSGKKTLHIFLSKGDVFGGISMLLNDGIAVRTLKINEDSDIYILPKKSFLDTCTLHALFSEYFTDAFGKRMLDRAYAGIIAKRIRSKEESSQFFSHIVASIFTRDLVFCDAEFSIQKAASVMSSNRCSSIFIRKSGGDFVGIVTDTDLRKKVIAKGVDIKKPVSEIMSSLVGMISDKALVFEALMVMMHKNIKHLAVTDADEKVIGVVTNSDLVAAQGQSPLFLIREITTADSVEKIIDKHSQLPGLIQNLISSGAKAKNVTRLITTISDAILNKLIGFAIEKSGRPPAGFVFMIMGSEGRKEQTLKTDLLQSSIFFDFRGAYGDMDLITELRKYLFGSLVGWPGFFRHLTENALHFKPPIGFFRNFLVESKGEHQNSFDIKSAMTPIVDFARIYALKNKLEETNTQERLYQLYLKTVLSWQDYNELEQAYSFLMQLRFIRQITSVIDENKKPDNYVNPKKLSSIEQIMLKEIFKRIEKMQTKLSFEFTGVP